MTNAPSRTRLDLLIALACGVCAAVLVIWLWRTPPGVKELQERTPIVRATPAAVSKAEVKNPGTLIAAGPRPEPIPDLPGLWPQFRGPSRDNIAKQATVRADWGEDGPPVLWRIPVGEGHAGAAIRGGRVYLTDYDREKEEDAVRCLALSDGSEVWRYTYSQVVKRNHGMSRTVPAVSEKALVSLGPKCDVVCLDPKSGNLLWKKDLVAEHGTKVPLWYAGQCPLIDGDRAILAPGAKPLMLALDLMTGQEVWRTEGHEDAGMTHSSIMAMELGGVRQFVYCANDGVYGVGADDGRILWHYPDWKIKIANIPSPLHVPPDRVFFSGGYGEGAEMVRVTESADAWQVERLFRLKPTVFGSDQQTPILCDGHIYGVEPVHAEMACLALGGKRLWTSGGDARFGIGPYLIAGSTILALDDETGTLVAAEATPEGWREKARAKLLNGHDAWAPMAYGEGRLILRDLTEMICVDVGVKSQ